MSDQQRRWFGLVVLLPLVILAVYSLWAEGSLPSTAFVRSTVLRWTNANQAVSALGFNTTNYTAVTNFVGNSASLTNLPAKILAGTDMLTTTQNVGQLTETLTIIRGENGANLTNIPLASVNQ